MPELSSGETSGVPAAPASRRASRQKCRGDFRRHLRRGATARMNAERDQAFHPELGTGGSGDRWCRRYDGRTGITRRRIVCGTGSDCCILLSHRQLRRWRNHGGVADVDVSQSACRSGIDARRRSDDRGLRSLKSARRGTRRSHPAPAPRPPATSKDPVGGSEGIDFRRGCDTAAEESGALRFAAAVVEASGTSGCALSATRPQYLAKAHRDSA